MAQLSLNQFLMLYLWFPLAALVMFVALIARLYERFSGRVTYFRYYLVPLILFGLAVVRYASKGQIAGDVPGDLLFASAGITMIGLNCRLYWLMLRTPHK